MRTNGDKTDGVKKVALIYQQEKRGGERWGKLVKGTEIDCERGIPRPV